jgi:HK97 family phage prohead protease
MSAPWKLAPTVTMLPPWKMGSRSLDDQFRQIVRTSFGPNAISLRSETNGSASESPIISGYAARFNSWTEISSTYEGHFLESIQPGAFARSLTEDRQVMLFNHGRDTIGKQVIAAVRTLREDSKGLYFEAVLLDGVPELIVSGIRHGAYGMSFMFGVRAESFDPRPKKSQHNPRGLPERVLQDVRLHEISAVTFPAYDGTSVGMSGPRCLRQVDWRL